MLKILPKLIQFLYKYSQIVYGNLNRILFRFFPLNPLVLRIRITNKCNLHCNFCYLSGSLNIGEENHLSITEWEKVIGKLPPWTIIDITGAEPFLAKNFREVLTMILDKGLKTSLITNGLKIDDEVLELLVEKKLYYLMFSIDGMKNYHNKVRGNEKSFDRLCEFIYRVQQIKKEKNSKYPLICIKTTITENNYEELIPLNKFVFETLGANSQTLNLMFQNSARGGIIFSDEIESEQILRGNTYSYPPESISSIKARVRSLLSVSKQNGWNINIKPNINTSWEDYIDDPTAFGVKACSRPHSVATMYYDGILSPCDITYKASNIREIDYNLKDMWKTQRFKKFYSLFKSKEKFFPACDGCCLAEQEKKFV